MNNTIFPEKEKSYRYVRYKGPKGSYCNIAEMAFFEDTSDTLALKGRIIGTRVVFRKTARMDYYKVYDGNPYTYMDYKTPDEGWVGLDFGIPRRIKKFAYIPRNSDNFIHKGDVYELFYWHDKEMEFFRSASGKSRFFKLCNSERGSLIFKESYGGKGRTDL